MADRSLQQLLRHLRRIAAPAGAGGLTDADLLGRFADNRDEAAFEALVWRHGPLVYGACRRLLGQAQDAEDAFQAAFLILARKAGSVRRRTAVGPWLYRVARRVAQRARSRVRTTGQLPDDLAMSKSSDPPESVELRRIVTEEVMRLPKRYRSAVVLRYLEGRSTAEAAIALACPEGTVLSRLAWARRRLRLRLVARGATLSAALAATTIEEAAGAVPARWVTAAVGAAGTFAAGGRAGRPAALAAEVLRAMFITRIRVGAVIVFGALAAGTGLLMPGTSPGRAEPQEKVLSAPFVEVTVVRPTRQMSGEFEEFSGRTEASATVDIRSRITGEIVKVGFQPGAKVKRGDVLFELDGRLAQVEMDRAQAEMQRAEAQMKGAEANFNRVQEIAKAAATGQAGVDNAKSAADEARAGLLAAKALLERAKLDVDATRIISPIDGQTGGTVLGVGNLAAPTTTLVTIVNLDPIQVGFDVNQNVLPRLQKLFQSRDAGVEIGLGVDKGFPRTGKITFVDNRVNLSGESSSTVHVRATLSNAKAEILPGMFVRVRLLIGEPREEWHLPEMAIRRMTGSAIAGRGAISYPFVLVVGTGNKIEWRPVTVHAARRAGEIVISEGVGPDDRVIVDSQPPVAGVPIQVREGSSEDVQPPGRGRRTRP